MDGVKIKCFPAYAPSEIYFFSPSLYRALKQVDADVIHAHGYQAYPLLASASAKACNKIPLVVTPHIGFSKVPKLIYEVFYNPIFGKQIFNRADYIVIISKNELEEIPQIKKYKDKVVWIPSGINFDRVNQFYQDNKRETSEIRIIYAGRIEKNKGIQYLLQALCRIRQSNNVKLLIVGEGPFAPKIGRMVQELGLSKIVSLLGKVSEEELYETYARSHIFVLLSSYESHSMAITEAMAFGLVPVATRVGGNAFLISDDIDGFLVSYPVDVNEVESVLNKLINEPTMLKKIGENARKNASDRFRLDNVVKRLEAVYQACCS